MKLIFKQQPYQTDATMAVVSKDKARDLPMRYGIMGTWVISNNNIMKHRWTDIPTGF